MNWLEKVTTREYGFSILFYVLSIYQLLKPDYLEMVLYIMAGTSFALMGLLKEDKFQKYKKTLDIILWTLIIFTAVYFLFMLRNDANF